MALKRRVTRKQFLKQPDEFMTTAQRMAEFIQSHTRLLYYFLLGIGGVIVLGGIVWLYMNGVQRTARDLENKALDIYHQPILSAEEANTRMGFTSKEDKYRSALVRFQQLADNYAWTKSGRRALLYIGDCYYGLKDYTKAKQAYEKYLAKYPDDDLMGSQVWHSLGYLSEAQGNPDEAISYYQKGLTRESSAGKFQLQLDIARCHELKQEWQKALDAYKKLAADYPQNPNIASIQQRIEELEIKVVSSASSPQPSS